jgi:hypothetical protein
MFSVYPGKRHLRICAYFGFKKIYIYHGLGLCTGWRMKQTLGNKRKNRINYVYTARITYNPLGCCVKYVLLFVPRCMVCIPLFVLMFPHVCSCYSISHFGSICSFPYMPIYVPINTLIRFFLKSSICSCPLSYALMSA